MDQAINKLTIELLSQPLFLLFVLVGIGYIMFSIAKKTGNYLRSIIGFIIFIIISFLLKQIISSPIGVILLILFIVAFIIFIVIYIIKDLGNKNSNTDIVNNKCSTNIIDQVNLKIACPKCGGTLIEREGKYGRFYGCSNYPKCKYTQNIK